MLISKKAARSLIKKKILLLFIFILLECVIIFSSKTLPSLFESVQGLFDKSVTITLTDKGFSPRDVEIRKGTKVIFKSLRKKAFWPASNIHPYHDLYPEFDARKPIKPSGSWSFIFEKEGSWAFHDHLAPLFTGKITVIDPNNKTLRELPSDNCTFLKDVRQKKTCWDNLFTTLIQKKGLQAAYDTYTKLFETQNDFVENCHGFTHIIGQAAYEKFKNHEDFPVDAKVAYCSYGFFHGFIEAMMQERGNLNQARDFCDYINNKLRKQTYSLSACFHGIGHGVTDASDKRTWRSAWAIISPGLSLCQKIGRDEYEIKLCATGVFNALAGMYMNPAYNLPFDRKNPFAICFNQTKEYFKIACFEDLKILIMYLTHNDFAQAVKYVEAIPQVEYAVPAMDSVATFNAYYILKEPDETKIISICHSVQERLRPSCIAGTGAGFMTAGIPDKEYIRAIKLCTSSLITDDERDACYKRVLPAIKNRYSQEKSQTICGTVDSRYKIYCST